MTDIPTNATIRARNEAGALMLRSNLDIIQQMKAPWPSLNQTDQTRIIEQTRNATEQSVDLIVRMLASANFTAFAAELESMNVKDGIKLACVVGKGVANRDELMDHVGGTIIIVLADSSQFLEGVNKIKATADQPELPLGEPEGDVAAEVTDAMKGPVEEPPADAQDEAAAALAKLDATPIPTARAATDAEQLIPEL